MRAKLADNTSNVLSSVRLRQAHFFAWINRQSSAESLLSVALKHKACRKNLHCCNNLFWGDERDKKVSRVGIHFHSSQVLIFKSWRLDVSDLSFCSFFVDFAMITLQPTLSFTPYRLIYCGFKLTKSRKFPEGSDHLPMDKQLFFLPITCNFSSNAHYLFISNLKRSPCRLVIICLCQQHLTFIRRVSILLVLRICRLCHVYYRLLILAVNIGVIVAQMSVT